ncbi:2-dehydro-3-deoxy-D-gluconate 5-dehydrogenase KduD [Glaciecola sp. MH2013]|uniref:2-dehydro-3-deoxy-D-gluconate 5-dehydrogenase KduD n=1 Tax=Glaciecola sp. MH2013 TaxID=2785524 RepID=UPI00189FD004|nr:2-dehydro-3-deoxy-D-gluconate 5-dehydrogenase KduD [Glaciecola sp. MH2013]MBF7073664.1 2-dehydro-3-deoxy-D-gluconate 5-dehydrogenase KduD [Glaciecola sp. MH2013]
MSDYLHNMFSLEGKVALVSGASRGLGKAMAIALASAGADLILTATNEANLQGTKDEIHALGKKARAIACDQSKPEQIQAVFEIVAEEYGRLDILINNAGTIRRAPAHETSDDDWNHVIDTNLNGVFQFCRNAGKLMLEQGSGKIINVASLLTFSGGITVPAYAASKGAVGQLTKALANEWANSNIQVNAIAPGYFATDNTQQLRDDKERNASISARIPTGKWGQPDDLAGAAVFLSSQASNYVNGHILLVDGGWMAR